MEKYFNCECNNRLFEKYKTFISNIDERLNKCESAENIKAIEKLSEYKLPQAFVDFYSKFDGEKDNSYLGMILGLSLMSAKEILKTIYDFSNMDFEIMSMSTGIIKDDSISNRLLIPFAFDGSRCFIAIDMSPDENGKEGQVITIDLDYDKSYLLASSLDEFYSFILKLFDSKKFFTSVGENEDIYFEFESGHFFNNLDDIFDESEDNLVEIELVDEFWKQYYNDALKDNKISRGVLEKEKRLFIKNEKLSFKPLVYMSNLRELIIHDCIISDFSSISKAYELRKLYLVNCIFNKEELSSISSMPNLAVISLNCMEIQSISSLASLKSLKELSLRKIDTLNIDELSLFEFLKSLKLEDLNIKNFDFINSLKSLKELTINKIKVNNLSFLKNLKNLTKFVMHEKAEDESDISLITELKKIKEFQYPVSNMEIYKSCQSVVSIGVDARNIHNIEMLKDTKINDVTVYNALSKVEAEEIIYRIKNWVNLSSYGFVGV